MKQNKVRLDAMIDPLLKRAAAEVAEENGISVSILIAQALMQHPTVYAKVQAISSSKER